MPYMHRLGLRTMPFVADGGTATPSAVVTGKAPSSFSSVRLLFRRVRLAAASTLRAPLVRVP